MLRISLLANGCALSLCGRILRTDQHRNADKLAEQERSGILCSRYKALSSLQLPWISQKRAAVLADAFVASEALPTVEELCATEPFAVPKALLRNATLANASVAQVSEAAGRLQLHKRLDTAHARAGGDQTTQQVSPAYASASSREATSTSTSSAVAEAPAASAREPHASDPLSAALSVYDAERYILLPARADGVARAGPLGPARELLDPRPRFVMALKSDASDKDKLKAMLQVAAHQRYLHNGAMAASSAGGDHSMHDDSGDAADVEAMLSALEYARDNVDAFQAALADKGWHVHDVIMWSAQKNVIQQ